MGKLTLEELQHHKAALDKRKSELEAEEIILRNEKERLQKEIKSLGFNNLAELSKAAQELEEEVDRLLREYEALLEESAAPTVPDIDAL